MKKFLTIFTIIFLFSMISCLQADNGDTENALLSCAESLFKSMKERDYPRIWSLLSDKSKKLIIDDVYKAANKKGASVAKENIEKDFASGGNVASSYWGSYLEAFNPDLALEESTWSMGKIEKDKAQIILRHKKAEAPAILKLFKEGGQWRVGLEETFRSSRP